jgi:TonB family protein
MRNTAIFASTLLLLTFCSLVALSDANEPDIEKQNAFESAYSAFQKHLEAGRVEDAIRYCEDAYELSKDIFGDAHKNTANLAYYYGRLLIKIKSKSATDILREAITRYEKVFGSESMELIPVLIAYGESISVGNWKQAEVDELIPQQVTVFQRALSIQANHNPDDRIGRADLLIKIAPLLREKNNNKTEAITMLDESLAIYEREYGTKSEKIVPILTALGDAHAKPFDSIEQIKFYDRGLKIIEGHLPNDKIQYADLSLHAGQELLQNHPRRARGYLVDALKIYEHELGDDHIKTAQSALGLGLYYYSAQDYFEAEKYLIRSTNIFTNNPNYRSFELQARNILTIIYEHRGKSDLATQQLLAIGKIRPWTSDQDIQPIFRVTPDYPRDALVRRTEGWVLVQFSIDEHGYVQDPQVIDSENSIFETAAIDAIKRWRYVPQFKDGKAIKTTNVNFLLRFQMAD